VIGFARPHTPPSGQSDTTDEDRPDFISHPQDLSDVEYDEDHVGASAQRVEQKRGGYQSRVEQILYEHPDLEIRITKADKNQEGGGNFITYLIVTGVCSTVFVMQANSTLSYVFRVAAYTRHLTDHILILMFRNSLYDADILTLPLSDKPWSTFILRSSSRQYPKSILWPTMQQNLPKRKRIKASSSYGSACSPCF
jgi:hypothetical protein